MDARQILVQKNMENYWRLASKTSYITFEASDRSVHAVSSASDALLNCVLSVQLSSDDAENTVLDLENFYSQHNKSFCWWVFPDNDATKLSNLLTLHNFKYAGILEGMVLPDVSKVDFVYKLPENITIKTVKTDAEFNDWIHPLTVSFELSKKSSSDYKSIFKELQEQTENTEHYVAYEDSKPVSSCSLFLDKDSNTAGIYNCGTIPEARKQGLCSALTRHGLFNAHQKGFETAVLQATHFSKNLFKEVGFEPCTSYKLYSK